MDDLASSFAQEIGAAATIQGILRQRARTTPNAPAVSFLSYPDGREQIETRSYARLDRRAGAIAAALLSRARPGDRVLLAHDAGLGFVEAFFGCLYAGMTAVPLAPPRMRGQARMAGIARDAGSGILLLTEAQATRWAPPDDQPLAVLASEALAGTDDYAFQEMPADEAPLAFLQYTSGTTGDPKGVMVRQAGLLANLGQIRTACGLDASSVVVSWLPHYHDMGLIGTLLAPIFTGFPTFLMSPLAFVQHPAHWLQAIGRHGATICGGPSFGYQHCIDRIPEDLRGSFDLSGWRTAFCGAEMIHAKTLARFAEAFAPSGFRPASFYPCYGMAEATLFLTGVRPDQGALVEDFDAAALEQRLVRPADAPGGVTRQLVGCGFPLPDMDIRIVDETGQEAADGHVGEIWASGPGLASGYWGKEEATREAFAAALPQAPGRTFLRTGDLGFFRHGQLFLSGRAKDLIIIDGRNVAPQDLEWAAAASHPAVVLAAAFAVAEDGVERAVMLVEIERRQGPTDLDAVSVAIRRAVAAAQGVPLAALALVRPGLLPRTTSGKLARGQARRAYLDNQFSPLHHWQSADMAAASPATLPATPWLLRPRIHPAPAHRLYCFGYGGGGASAFLPWRARLPDSIEICPIQLPGRETRLAEEPIRRIDPLLRLFEDLAPRQGDTPFSFFGFCMGGRFAFAVARHLRRRGLAGPRRLILGAVREPSWMPKKEIPTYRLRDAEILGYAERMGGVPPEILANPDVLRRAMQLFRADIELSETIEFADEPPLDCPITVFGGLDDTAARIEHLVPWREHATGGFTLRLVPGAHMFLEEQRDTLIAQTITDLAPFIPMARGGLSDGRT